MLDLIAVKRLYARQLQQSEDMRPRYNLSRDRAP